jgi:hypothetical protein
MEGIYTDEIEESYLNRETSMPWDVEPSTLLVPWEGWTDTEQSVDTSQHECITTIGSPVPQRDIDPNPVYPEAESGSPPLLHPISNETPDATGQTATDWGYTTPIEVIEEPPLLNRRGLPMRRSAMQVEERVKSIVKWENATEDSIVVRQIANAIDQEITRESSRKRMRVTTSETCPVAYDSEMSDGADGESEGEQVSEPDPDDTDTEFVAPDEEVEDEFEGAEVDESIEENSGDEEVEDDDSEDIMSSDEDSDDDMSTADEAGSDDDLSTPETEKGNRVVDDI